MGVPLYHTLGPECEKLPCDASIIEQPVDQYALNSRYAEHAKDLIRQFGDDSQFTAPFDANLDQIIIKKKILSYVLKSN